MSLLIKVRDAILRLPSAERKKATKNAGKFLIRDAAQPEHVAKLVCVDHVAPLLSRWTTLAVGKTGKVNPRQEPLTCNLTGLDKSTDRAFSQVKLLIRRSLGLFLPVQRVLSQPVDSRCNLCCRTHRQDGDCEPSTPKETDPLCRCARITPSQGGGNYTCWVFTAYAVLVKQPRNAPFADTELLGYLFGSLPDL